MRTVYEAAPKRDLAADRAQRADIAARFSFAQGSRCSAASQATIPGGYGTEWYHYGGWMLVFIIAKDAITPLIACDWEKEQRNQISAGFLLGNR
jgi:hypothetical protein